MTRTPPLDSALATPVCKATAAIMATAAVAASHRARVRIECASLEQVELCGSAAHNRAGGQRGAKMLTLTSGLRWTMPKPFVNFKDAFRGPARERGRWLLRITVDLGRGGIGL